LSNRSHSTLTARWKLAPHELERATRLGEEVGHRRDFKTARMARPGERDPLVDRGGLFRRFDAQRVAVVVSGPGQYAKPSIVPRSQSATATSADCAVASNSRCT
jgi:hypothetical protein